MSKDKNKEKFKKNFLKLCKEMKPIDEEPEEKYDIGINYEEEDSLSFEEEQELDDFFEESVDELSKLMTPIEDEDED